MQKWETPDKFQHEQEAKLHKNFTQQLQLQKTFKHIGKN